MLCVTAGLQGRVSLYMAVFLQASAIDSQSCPLTEQHLGERHLFIASVPTSQQ